MSSTPATPTQVTPAIPVWITAWTNFVKAHEKLLMRGGIILLLWHLGGKAIIAWDAHEARKDSAAVTAATTALTQQQAANAQLAQLYAGLQTQIADLKGQIKNTQTKIVSVPTQIAQIPPDKLQGDIETKMGGPILSTPVLTKIDTEITDYPLMQEELDQVNAEITAQQNSNVNLQGQIAGLNAELVDEKNVCTATTAQAVLAQKTKDNKHKKFWYKVAFVGGAIVGGFIGHGI